MTYWCTRCNETVIQSHWHTPMPADRTPTSEGPRRRAFPPHDAMPDYLRSLETCHRWVPNDDDCFRHFGPHEPFRCNGAKGRLIEVHHEAAASPEELRHNQGSCDLCTGWHDVEEAEFMNRKAAQK